MTTIILFQIFLLASPAGEMIKVEQPIRTCATLLQCEKLKRFFTHVSKGTPIKFEYKIFREI